MPNVTYCITNYPCFRQNNGVYFHFYKIGENFTLFYHKNRAESTPVGAPCLMLQQENGGR